LLSPISHAVFLSIGALDYVQSQMLLIVLTLALGFSMLLLIAVLLCAVITFTRPVDTPRLPARLAVIGVSLAMTAAAAAANAFDEDFGTGLSELVNSLSDLRLIAQGVQADAAVLLTDTQSVGVAVEAIAVCLGCPHLQSGAASSAMTSEAMCKDLAARRDVIVHGQMFAEDVRDGPAHFQRAIDTLRYATGWHSWTTSLPFFALLMTACAVTIGTCVGRRSLLVGTQFFAVIAWWMLCAITAIQLAIAVGLADACVDPTATVIRVLQWFVSQTKSRTDRDMYDLEMTRHYLMNCSLPNPVVSPLFNISSSLSALSSNLTALGAPCASSALLQPAKRAIVEAQGNVAHIFAVLEGDAACNRVQRDFHDGVEIGLCTDLTQGVVGVLLWQCMCGGLLLLLAALLPTLWHSHWLPPMSCTCRTEPWRRRFRRLMQHSESLTDRLLPAAEPVREPLLEPLSAPAAITASPLLTANRPDAEGQSNLELNGAGDDSCSSEACHLEPVGAKGMSDAAKGAGAGPSGTGCEDSMSFRQLDLDGVEEKRPSSSSSATRTSPTLEHGPRPGKAVAVADHTFALSRDGSDVMPADSSDTSGD